MQSALHPELMCIVHLMCSADWCILFQVDSESNLLCLCSLCRLMCILCNIWCALVHCVQFSCACVRRRPVKFKRCNFLKSQAGWCGVSLICFVQYFVQLCIWYATVQLLCAIFFVPVQVHLEFETGERQSWIHHEPVKVCVCIFLNHWCWIYHKK